MGYVKRTDLHTIFDRIRHDAISSTACTVLLLTAVNVDALCALKILMFKAEPVAGYDDITAIAKSAEKTAHLRSVVLVGCGAVVDVAGYLRLPSRCSVYILDGQRPISLDNLFNNSQVFFVDDGTVEAEERTLKDAFEGSLIESDNDSSDTEEENTENTTNQRRRKLKRHFYDHLANSQFGTCASRLAYELADSLNKTNNTFLWCAIVGSLSHHLLEHTTKRQWEHDVTTYRRHLSRFTTTIRYEPEFRFTLCRHWNIHDSMLHSRYVSSRLQLWRDRGWRRLTELYASMGVPLDQCKRDWFVMEKQFRDHFGVQLERYAPRFGLEQVRVDSFVKEVPDVGVGVTAGDAVHALSALIEAPSDSRVDRFEAIRANFTVALQALDHQYQTWIIFIISIYRKGSEHLQHGIKLAISQHQDLFKQLSAIFTHRLLRYGRRYRYAVMRGADNTTWLHHPTALLRLALFLVSAASTHVTRKSHLPLLLACHQPASDSYLVVAVPTGHGPTWHFSEAYRRAAEQCKARIRHDSFDATVVEVAQDDLRPFIKALQHIK